MCYESIIYICLHQSLALSTGNVHFNNTEYYEFTKNIFEFQIKADSKMISEIEG